MSESYMKEKKNLLRYVILTRDLAYALLYNSKLVKRVSEIMSEVSS